MRLVLFDIDGTLLLSGGAGTRSLYRAFQIRYGIEPDWTAIRFDGKTDPLIIQEIVSKYGVDDEPGQDLYDIYLSILPDEVRRSPGFQVLAGARELVIRLSADPGFLIGLATGNVETGARLKLERAGLSSYFPFGGYGSDSGDRTELIRAAIRRGSELAAPLAVGEVFVIGDTPRDVRHGRAAGATTIAVATGNYGLDELKDCGPDLAVAGLQPMGPILEFMESGSRTGREAAVVEDGPGP
ncbi:MAG: HAD family hydrolase [Acidobacteriota bacterium]|nr:HAD family hydrolase [Acidobacteriota bacterium]